MKKILIAAACLTVGLAAQAQTVDKKFYGGIEVGVTQISDQTAATNASLVSALGGTASSSQDTSVNDYRIFGGYKFNENIGAELGYMQTSNFDMTVRGVTGGSVAYTGSASAKLSGYDYSVLLRPSISSNLNNLFLRLGGHYYTADATGSVTATGGNASMNTSKSGSGFLYGIGYDLNVLDNVGVRFSVNHLDKIAGDSENSATVYSIGVLARF